MKVREATKEDWSAIKALIDNSPELMKTRLTSYRSFFVAEHEGRVVGCGALAVNVQEDLSEDEVDKSPKTAEIRSLAVEPEFQGQGIGSRIVQRCLDRAHERKVYEVATYTNAPEFFEKFGLKSNDGWKYALFVVLKNSRTSTEGG